MRDLADVVDVEEVVPAASGVPLARRDRPVVVHVAPGGVRLLGREEHTARGRCAAPGVQVADVLGDDDARLDAHLDRVHQYPQQHVRVDVQHVVDVSPPRTPAPSALPCCMMQTTGDENQTAALPWSSRS